MKIYSKASNKSIEVKRGEMTETTEGIFKFVGQRNSNLYYMREMSVSDRNGNLYPVRGGKGEYQWTAQEVYDAFSRCRI